MLTPIKDHKNHNLTYGKTYPEIKREFSRGMHWVLVVNDENKECWYYLHNFITLESTSDNNV